jgi:feruloyl esterase
MHTGVVVGKEITKSFYGSAHTKSYYLGCSTGGRQGFKAVQDFPEDFDGVVVGAPAVGYDNLTSWSAHFFNILGDNSTETFLPIELWTAVHQMVLDQCDGIDGLVDGIIEDPSLCIPRPEAIICAAGNMTNCLTSPQAASVRAIFSDWYGVDGVMIYPRMNPGSELIARSLYYTGKFFAFSNVRYVHQTVSSL